MLAVMHSVQGVFKAQQNFRINLTVG